jgi:hypothetical protein
MEGSYVNPTRGALHLCDVLVLHCLDWRFHEHLDGLLRQVLENLAGWDRLALPGASKAVLEEASRPTVLAGVQAAVLKHGITRVVVVDHADCAAWGGSVVHANPEAERGFHEARLAEAARVLERAWPNLRTLTMYQDWERLRVVQAANRT